MTWCPRQVLAVDFSDIFVPSRKLLARSAEVITQPLCVFFHFVIAKEFLGRYQGLSEIEDA